MPTEDKLPVGTESKTCRGWVSAGTLSSPPTSLNWSLQERNQAPVSMKVALDLLYTTLGDFWLHNWLGFSILTQSPIPFSLWVFFLIKTLPGESESLVN